MEILVEVLAVIVLFVWLPFAASVVLYHIIKHYYDEE